MFWFPKKLKSSEINFLYGIIRERTDDFIARRWKNFLQYFYDAEYNIDSFDKNEFREIKKNAIDSHYNYFHFAEILDFKSFHKNPISKKFFELKNLYPADYNSDFFEYLWRDILEHSCLHKQTELNSRSDDVIEKFTSQIFKNIHSLICKSDLNDLLLVVDVELNSETGGIKSKDDVKKISEKYYPFLLTYFDTISLYTHLLSHLDLFKKHHKFLLKQAEKVNEENDSMSSEIVLDFLHDSRAEFFDTILGFGDNQRIFKQNENYKKYKKELDDAINAIENFTKTCIVYSEFTKNNSPEDNLHEYKISINEQLDYVRKVDEDLFSKLNSSNSKDIKEIINYYYPNLLNFKFLNKLLEFHEMDVNLRLDEYGQMTNPTIILGTQ